MAVSLSFRDNVQIVTFSLALTATEAKALQAKLNEKLQAGRNRQLMNVTAMHLDSEGVQHMRGVLLNLLGQGVRIAVVGLPDDERANLPRELRHFADNMEALAWLQERPDVSLEQRAVELVRQYEPFQDSGSTALRTLRQAWESYRQKPQPESIVALQTVCRDIKARESILPSLRQNCEKHAAALAEVLEARHLPRNEAEWRLLNQQAQTEQMRLGQEVSQLQVEVNSKKLQAQTFVHLRQGMTVENARRLRELQDQVDHERARLNQLRTDLAEKTALEENLLQALRSTRS